MKIDKYQFKDRLYDHNIKHELIKNFNYRVLHVYCY